MDSRANLLSLARPEIRSLKAYVPASYEHGLTRLNANEAPYSATTDASGNGLNRYPPARPTRLTERLAAHYGVASGELFVTRGSSEAIDLVIRCFCRPGLDRITICPPTFGMYRVYADIQGAKVDEVPLVINGGVTQLPVDEIVGNWRGTSRLVFVTTPNNPTGGLIDTADIRRLANALLGRGVIVIDAAYIEFSSPDSVMALTALENVVILRTLSKSFGLAGARCGALIARPALLDLIARVMPPYAIPTPTADIAISALPEQHDASMPGRIREVIEQRENLRQQLAELPCVRRVWPSDANFLLVEFDDPDSILTAARDAGFLLRDFSRAAMTANCLRISIGTPDDNARLLAAIKEIQQQRVTT